MTELRPLNTDHRPVKLRVADYLLLDGAGAFAAYAKTELLDGDIYFMNAQHRPHARMKMAVYDVLRDALRAMGSPLRPLVEVSVALAEQSAPEPDIVVTSEPDGDGLVPCSTIALIVEVADTTLASDLGLKAQLYAAAGIPEYWVADLNARVIHQMWAPEGEAYAARREVAFGEVIEAVTIDRLTAETNLA